MADTLGAAWAVALFGFSEPRGSFAARIVPIGENVAALASLPVESLRLSAATLRLLKELGLDVCRPLLHLARAALAERFESELVARLLQACGETAEPFASYRPEPTIAAERSWENGLNSTGPLHVVWQSLLPKLLAITARKGYGIAQLSAELVGESGGRRRLVVGLLRPTLDARHLLDLLMLRLETLRVHESIVGTRLAVLEQAPVAWQQQMLFDELAPPVESSEWKSLVERLAGRLGGEGVVRIRPRDDHQPECAWRAVPWGTLAGTGIPRRRPNQGSLPTVERPTMLLPRPRSIRIFVLSPQGHPQQFEDRGKKSRIVRSWGPERIETGWWRGPDVCRDYFRCLTESGTQVWLFRDLRSRRWFLHGWFD
ncbi:MAG: hypothetical protein QM775_10545 [Pirellulales bacterium]